MNTTAILLATSGAASVLVAWVTYIATIPRGKVPERPVGTFILQLAGMALAAAGVAWSMRDGASPGAAVIAPAGFAGFMGVFFLFLFSQRKTPVGDIKVSPGDALLPFQAVDANGQPFHSDSFAGTRVLLKFFRGAW